jgi:acyl-CoA reductase-like NAD-dependent aldehyde dehydrogenase
VDMFIAGRWTAGKDVIDVRNPYSGEVIDTAPRASTDDAHRALAAAKLGARQIGGLPAHRRAELLESAAVIVEQRGAELASIICAEQGKTLQEATGEATRIGPLLRYCAAEAVRRHGEMLALDSSPSGVGRLAFTLPEPCGVVVAITPFNYPALLVAHKIGPGLAAGNAIILKPAVTTPLTALFLTRCLNDAGIPDLALQCITGSGAELGPALCASPVVRKVSFTGSVDVGHAIARAAGAKRLTCELGSHAAVIVLEDADIAHAAREIVRSGYTNAGQVCISAQRVLVDERRRDDLVNRVLAAVDELTPGDPSEAATTLGPVITGSEAERIVTAVRDAGAAGGDVVRGGDTSGGLVEPAVVLDAPLESSLWTQELFGPAVAIRSAQGLDDAIRVANDSPFGLSMSVFTQDIDRALTFARTIDSGMVHINSGPLFRVDAMPYGGVKDSGYGKEGIRYAMDEMTEHKLVVIHPGANA